MTPVLTAGLSLFNTPREIKKACTRGVTLIELVIVVTVIGILLTIAMPTYSNYMLRVHRTEAIRMLLQAAMCQQRLYVSRGHFDTSLCQPTSEKQRYRLTYTPPASQGLSYRAMATPHGAQLDDPCGSLFMDQNGVRGISANDISVMKCWSSR